MNFNELDKIEEVKCIYGILNKVSNKWYVGSTINLHDRIRRHKYNLQRNKHHSQKLQNSFNKHKEKAFEIVILELCSNLEIDDLIIREKHYIDLLDSYKNGYNSTDNVYKFDTFRLSKEAIEKVAEKNIKPIICLTKDGKFVKEYKSVTEAANDMNDQTTNISQACKDNYHSVKGFLFIYKDKYDPNKSYKYLEKKMSEEHKQKIKEKAKHNKRNRKIFEYDTDNNLLQVYFSARSLEQELNLKPDTLRQYYNKSKFKTKFQIQDRFFEIEDSYYLYKDIV